MVPYYARVGEMEEQHNMTNDDDLYDDRGLRCNATRSEDHRSRLIPYNNIILHY